MSSSQALKSVATGQATPEQSKNPYEALKRQLEASKGEFLPLFGQSQQNVERFVRVVLNSVLANPDLLDVNRRTLISACMKAAQDGLLPDGREAVLNVYNVNAAKRGEPPRWEKHAQYLPMVGGLVKKLYESGEIKSIQARCVYERDKFLYRLGDDPRLDHEPTSEDEPGRIIAAYVRVKLKNDETLSEVMFRRDIEAVKAASKAGNGPWTTWYDQMAIKSVIKRAYKLLPKTDAFERIVESDNQAMGFTATPESVADIAGRNAAPATPQLEQRTDAPMTFDMPERERQAVPVGRETDPGTGEISDGAPGPRKTYAEHVLAVQSAKDKDAAQIALDMARADLADEQLRALQAAYAARWEQGGA